MTTLHTNIIKAKHCMVDLETLGSNPSSPVIQIGLVFFTIDGIDLKAQCTIDFNDALKYGEADGSTIKWWLSQPKEAQEKLFENTKTMAETIEIFNRLIKGQNANYYWAHATFDFPILISMFRNYGGLDMRTLEYLAGDIEWEKRTGIHHCAVDDASYQAIHAIKMLKTLNKGDK